jgi:ElaB/YqjD/DUF883 family membrane-anchored ribosome-binding protein
MMWSSFGQKPSPTCGQRNRFPSMFLKISRKGAVTMADRQTRLGEQETSVEDAIAALTERFDKFAKQFGDNARSAGQFVSDTVDDSRNQVQETAREGYDNVRSQGRRGVKNVSDSVRSVYDTMDEGSRQVQEAVREGYREVRHQGQRGMENVSGRIEEHPLSSVLLGLSVGFLVGWVSSSARFGKMM